MVLFRSCKINSDRWDLGADSQVGNSGDAVAGAVNTKSGSTATSSLRNLRAVAGRARDTVTPKQSEGLTCCDKSNATTVAVEANNFTGRGRFLLSVIVIISKGG
jgi:hypothetical protein